MSTPMLETKGINKTFPGTQALQDVSFQVLPGEVHALVGENGAGKSTLMHILSSVLEPGSGETLIQGNKVKINHPKEAQDLGIGTVFQELSLIPNLSVAENVFPNRAPTRGGGEMLAQAIGGQGKVLLGTFPAPNVLDRVEGYKAVFAEKYPDIEVVDTVNDQADPSYAPTAYAAAIQAHPDVVGIGGTDGDSGKGAAVAVRDAGKKGQIKIVATDRNEDMLDFIEDGTIIGSVAQKSYLEMFMAINLLYWLNHDVLKVLPDWKAAQVNPLPEQVQTGVMMITQDNVSQFRHQ